MRKKISVTQEDIDAGLRGRQCVIAKALTSHGVDKAEVYFYRGFRYHSHLTGYKLYVRGGWRIKGSLGDRPFRVKAPRSVAQNAVAFDKHRPIKPFNFFLNIPEARLEAGLMRYLSREPFGHYSTVSQVDKSGSCAWCGQPAKYRYGVFEDQRNRPNWQKQAFCSIQCSRSYYN